MPSLLLSAMRRNVCCSVLLSSDKVFSNSDAAQRPQRWYRLSERKEDAASAARRTEAGRKEAEIPVEQRFTITTKLI